MNEKKQKRRIYSIIAIIFLSILSSLVNAANIGVSPASINFADVLRAGYAQREIIISTDSLEDVGISLESMGSGASWINFSNNNFTINRDNPGQVVISINPPVDIPNGDYSSFVRITTSSWGKTLEGQAVGKIKAYLDLILNTQITDKEIISCNAKNINLYSVEKGDDLVINLDYLNSGNVRLNPKISTLIWDSSQSDIVYEEEFVRGEIFPTKQSNLEIRIPTNNLDFGQYWIEIITPDCYDKELLTFDVLEPGALTANGVLLGIINQKKANVSEVVPINVKFKNTGQKELDAFFSGKINKGEEIIRIVESPRAKVGIGEEYSFDFYFTPEKSGTYVISGRVLYNSKRTFESSSVIEVIGDNFNIKTILFILLYSIILFLIILFIYKIKEEKEKYKLRLRSIK